MKLSDKTVAILQGFAQINAGLLLRPGTRQKTLDQVENGMFAVADLDEEIPFEFGLLNLNTFLGNLAVFEDYQIEFKEKDDKSAYGYMLVRNDDFEMRWQASSPKLIKAPPADAEIKQKGTDFTFKLSARSLNKLRDFAGVNKEHIVFTGEDGYVYGDVIDPQAKSYDPKNRIRHRIGPHNGKPFNMAFEARYFKGLVNADYKVNVAIDQMVEFVTGDESVHYYIMPTVFKND